jgi:hypothetical protein
VLRRIVFLLALVGALFMSTAAVASARDRNHDRLPDRWEKRHDLKLKFKQAKRDQDRDGLKNLAEFRAHMDPRDDDSDDDGVGDDEENAGKIASFEDGRLTIALFAGGEVSGLVTDDTEIECGDDEQGDDDEHGDDDRVASASHDDPGDDDEGDDDEDDECAADALTANAVVKEAELTLGSGGAVFDEIELR